MTKSDATQPQSRKHIPVTVIKRPRSGASESEKPTHKTKPATEAEAKPVETEVQESNVLTMPEVASVEPKTLKEIVEQIQRIKKAQSLLHKEYWTKDAVLDKQRKALRIQQRRMCPHTDVKERYNTESRYAITPLYERVCTACGKVLAVAKSIDAKVWVDPKTEKEIADEPILTAKKAAKPKLPRPKTEQDLMNLWLETDSNAKMGGKPAWRTWQFDGCYIYTRPAPVTIEDKGISIQVDGVHYMAMQNGKRVGDRQQATVEGFLEMLAAMVKQKRAV